MLKLVEFIKEHEDWENLIQREPYCITIKRQDNLIMFSYNQLSSDFTNPVVKECRGIILEDKTFRPVCVPFFKFGNYGESYVDTIDWHSARVQEKVDGSLIKLWYYNDKWNVSTNGTIYANMANLQNNIMNISNYYELFVSASKSLNYSLLDKDYTYMFELISPLNRVVVPYSETAIVHLGARSNITLKEFDVDLVIRKPKSYGFTSLEECISMASELPFSQEGYVVVDRDWHRIKVKSPAYVSAHYLINNRVITKSRIINMIKINEYEEFLTYFPQYKEYFDEIISAISNMDNEINKQTKYINNNIDKSNRKEFAMYVSKTFCPAYFFNWLDNKCNSFKEWLFNLRSEQIATVVENYKKECNL